MRRSGFRRSSCGGRMVCVSPLAAILIVILFLVLLFSRCQEAKHCASEAIVSRETIVQQENTDVSRETS